MATLGNRNVAPYTITIYAGNAFIQPDESSQVELASLTAANGFTSYTAKCFGYYYTENQEGDPIEGVGGALVEKTVVRPQINPQLSPFLIKTETDEHKQFLAVMRRRYKYFYEVTSENTTRLHATDKAVYVVTTGREIDQSDGNINITLTLDYGVATRG
jgi:hypothetical protein